MSNFFNILSSKAKFPYYKKLQYLQTSGNQCVETSLSPRANIQFVAKIYIDGNITTQQTIFGSFYNNSTASTSNTTIKLSIDNTNIIFTYGSVSTTIPKESYVNKFINIRLSNKKLYINENLITTYTNTITSSSRNITLFCFNDNNTKKNYCTNCKIAYISFLIDGVKNLDMIPVLTYNYVACFYDKITQSFFYDTNNNNFKILEYKTKLLYLQSDGTQIIQLTADQNPAQYDEIEIEFDLLNRNGYVFAGTGTEGVYWNASLWTNSNGIYFARGGYGNQEFINGLTPGLHCNLKIWKDISDNRYHAILNGQECPNTLANASYSSYPIALFGQNQNGIAKPIKNRIYRYKIKDKIDLIPVLDWNNIPCMYDNISKHFFYNQKDSSNFKFSIQNFKNTFQVKYHINSTSDTYSFTINKYTYCIVDWGDGTCEFINNNNVSKNASHIYSKVGDYTVKLIGDISGLHISQSVASGPSSRLANDIYDTNFNWKSLGNRIINLDGCFYNLPNLSGVVKKLPNTVTSIHLIFNNCNKLNFKNIFPLNNKLIKIKSAFAGTNNTFDHISNLPLNATDAQEMFINSKAEFNINTFSDNAPQTGYKLTNILDMFKNSSLHGSAATFLHSCPLITTLYSSSNTSPFSNSNITMFDENRQDWFQTQISTTSSDQSYGMTINSSKGKWYIVDWGDGSNVQLSTFINGTKIQHNYAEIGTYTQKIACVSDRIKIDNYNNTNYNMSALTLNYKNYKIISEYMISSVGTGNTISNPNTNNSYVTLGTKQSFLSGTYLIPEDGNYYIWLRSLAFTNHWRKVIIYIDQNKFDSIGDYKPQGGTDGKLYWEKSSKTYNLSKGKHVFKLTPTNAYCCRPSILLLTKDQNYIPSDYASNASHLIEINI